MDPLNSINPVYQGIEIEFIENISRFESDAVYVVGLDNHKKLARLGEEINKSYKIKSLIDSFMAQKVEEKLPEADQEEIFFHCLKDSDSQDKNQKHSNNISVMVFPVSDKKKSTVDFEKMGARIFKALSKKTPHVVIDLRLESLALQCHELAAALASGAFLRSFEFDFYKGKDKKKSNKLTKISFVTSDFKKAQEAFEHYKATNLGNFLTRHLVSEPPNVLHPESMATFCKQLTELGIEVEVLGEARMRELGFGALLGVGQGSAKESKLIILKWNGAEKCDKEKNQVAIIGKGVTFDTGGISIKPSSGMEDMKYDMAGSGVVVGLLKALALRKAQVNVVGVMGMAENMPSGTAQRPSDVVRSLSGQTIEVINTDAEGRLVLADALWYTKERFKPEIMIDLATLTGAIVVALGHEYAGLFSNDDTLSNSLLKASEKSDEKLWRLPLDEAYDKDIDSDIADMKNVGSGRGAGSTTAAHFLKRFVGNTKWAHLDIAGVAWEKKDHPLFGKGATGFGVRLLNQWILDNFENN